MRQYFLCIGLKFSTSSFWPLKYFYLCYVIYSYVLDKDGDVPATINVEDSPSSPTHVSGVNKAAGSNYGSVPKERRSRFPRPLIGKYFQLYMLVGFMHYAHIKSQLFLKIPY